MRQTVRNGCAAGFGNKRFYMQGGPENRLRIFLRQRRMRRRAEVLKRQRSQPEDAGRQNHGSTSASVPVLYSSSELRAEHHLRIFFCCMRRMRCRAEALKRLGAQPDDAEIGSRKSVFFEKNAKNGKKMRRESRNSIFS